MTNITLETWPFTSGNTSPASIANIDPFALLLERGNAALLYVSVLKSLFTDKTAEPDTELPTPESTRRGWWGDKYKIPANVSDSEKQPASLLWLYSRRKLTITTATEIITVIENALEWMVTAKIASEVLVNAKNDRGRLAVSIEIINTAKSGGIKLQTPDFWSLY